MCSALMKALRVADNLESFFEAWKRSALLCGRFAVSLKSQFQASKRTNMGSAVL